MKLARKVRPHHWTYFMSLFSFHTPLKTSENLWFSDIFRGYRKNLLTWNRLTFFTPMSHFLPLKTSENQRFSDVFRGYRNRHWRKRSYPFKVNAPIRSRPPEVFVGKEVCSKFTVEHPCWSKITFCHGYSPINLLHIFRTPFPKNTSGGLFLTYEIET